jgi:hypothetical protein
MAGLINLKLLTDFFNKICQKRTFCASHVREKPRHIGRGFVWREC